MDVNYCPLCQEAHQMSSDCVLQHAQCKECGERGHFRKDCEQGSRGGARKAFQEPVLVAQVKEEKTKCTKCEESFYPSEFRVHNRNEHEFGCELGNCDYVSETELDLIDHMKRFHISEPSISSSSNCLEEDNNQTINYQNENIHDCVQPPLDGDVGTCERRGRKRKLSDQGSPFCSKSLKLDDFILKANDSRTNHLHASPGFENQLEEDLHKLVDSFGSGVIRVSLDAAEEEDSFGDGETTGHVIYISDDEEYNPDAKDTPSEEFITLSEWPENIKDASGPVVDDQKDIELGCEVRGTSPDLLYKHQEQEKSQEMMAGLYTIVCVHLELFRSSKSGSGKLTQLGCVVSGLDHNSFFRAIKPGGIKNYLDHYKLGGDLLQALHMTREDDGTFLFRSRFEAITEEEKIICIEEREALESFLDFLQSFPNCVVVGVDEETVAILANNLKFVDREKFKIVSGFTYWKRILKYLDVQGYKSTDLEEYYASLTGRDLPSFNSAVDIALVLLESVKDVTRKEKGGKKSVDANFYKLCKRIECIKHPSRFEYDPATDVENVEVFSSFRPAVSATIRAEKLEEIVLSSESDSEPEETGRSQTRLDKQKEKRKQARMRRKLRKSSQQLKSTIEETGMSQAELSKSGMEAILDPGKVPPLRIKTLLQKSGSNYTVPMQKPKPPNADTWQLGQPTPNEGTIICPSPKCTSRLKYSKLFQHLSKQHPSMVMESLLCPVCKKSVTPAEVRVHMPRCSPGPAKKPRVPNTIAQQAPSVKSITLRCATALSKATLSNANKPKAPAVSCNPLPGLSIPVEWSVVEDNTASAQALAALRIVLDSYLLTNFVPFPGGLNNCLKMYKHYQETMQSQGHREVMSSANFVSAVAELAKAHWNIDVGPARVESGQLYFRRFKKFTTDSFHTVL